MLVACSVSLFAKPQAKPTMTVEQEQQFLYYFYAARHAIEQQNYDRAYVLLNFCHDCALTMTAQQRLFCSSRQKMIEKFRKRYAEIYSHATSTMHVDGTNIVDELQYTYGKMTATGLAEPIEKWRHLLNYIKSDMVRTDLYPTLGMQLERYVTDLCTSKEADMCGNSLEERYIISTVHKAKGLEFETVIVYRAIDGSYPGTRSWTETQIQEDARKLFVALSRSKKRLCVIYDDYYGRSPHVLSPFLEKVKEHFTLYRRGSDGKIREAL